MLKKTMKVTNRYGIHARPSSLISELALEFKSDITIEYNEKTANAESIMNLILLCVEPNTEITVIVDGEDEQEAMEQMTHLIEVTLPHEEWEDQ